MEHECFFLPPQGAWREYESRRPRVTPPGPRLTASSSPSRSSVISRIWGPSVAQLWPRRGITSGPTGERLRGGLEALKAWVSPEQLARDRSTPQGPTSMTSQGPSRWRRVWQRLRRLLHIFPALAIGGRTAPEDGHAALVGLPQKIYTQNQTQLHAHINTTFPGVKSKHIEEWTNNFQQLCSLKSQSITGVSALKRSRMTASLLHRQHSELY